MDKNSKIYIAGHTGLVGSALVRELDKQGFNNLLTVDSNALDLTDFSATSKFFIQNKPDYVFLAAAKVGGIVANNTYPVDFLEINLKIQLNIIHSCFKNNIKRLLFLGSSCIYPKACPQPMKEEYLLTGPLEPTNSAYAIAKIAGLEQCYAYNKQYGTEYIAAMPTNLYGPNDNYDLKNSHVIPGLIHKMHLAKMSNQQSVTLWGTGNPKREFLYSDDLAKACIKIMQLSSEKLDKVMPKGKLPLINIGSGKEITIKELAQTIKQVVGFTGDIIFDPAYPDGTMQKLLNIDKLKMLNIASEINLKDGLKLAYQNFLELNLANLL